MTAAAPSPVVAKAFRGEAVTVLANMTMAALGGGGDERRGEDQRHSPRSAGGDLSAPVVDGAGPRAHRATTRQYGMAEEAVRLGWARPTWW